MSKRWNAGETQGKGEHEDRPSMARGLTRRAFLKMSGAGLAGAALLSSAACGGGVRRSITEAVAAAAPGASLRLKVLKLGENWNT